MKVELKELTIETVIEDIASQKQCQAVVNAANAELRSGGGVAGALHREAGPALEKATKVYAPIEVSEVIITKAFNLPNDYVLHALGPIYGVDNPSDKLLRRTYDNIFNLLKRHKISSVAMPAISTGAFGYPKKHAAIIALNALKHHLNDITDVKTIRFILYDEETLTIYQTLLKELFENA